MKNIIKVLAWITLIGLILYAAFLCYEKLVKKSEDEWDDLEDWGYEFEDEEPQEISFSDRVKAAAEKQLAKVR